jgi:hypothetical protein
MKNETYKITVIHPAVAAELVAGSIEAERDQVLWNCVQAVASKQITPQQGADALVGLGQEWAR